MAVDWKSLRPHVPAGGYATHAGEPPALVARPDERSLRSLVRETTEPLAVVGPAGSGKSSALSQLLREPLTQVGCVPVLLDHIRDELRGITLDAASESFFRAFTSPASFDDLMLAVTFFLALMQVGAASRGSGAHIDEPTRRARFMEVCKPYLGLSSHDQIRSLARDLRAALGVSQLVILLDGMERLPTETIRTDLERLLRMRAEFRVVAVLPAQVLYGPDAAWMTEQFRVYSVPPVVVTPANSPHAAAGRAFLREVLRTRVGDEGLRASADVLEAAISLSGGIPRTFLQLVQDSAMYARLAGRDALRESDLTAAVKDQRQSLRRLLDQGDKQEILRADGTDGAEIPRDRRARLIASGLILEYEEDGELVVHPAPILEPILRRPAA